MPSIHRLAVLTTLAIFAEAIIVPPASQGVPDLNTQPVDLNGATTDITGIVSTASLVDQKSGPSLREPPNLPSPETAITAIDNTLVKTTVTSVTNTRRSLVKRSPSDYVQVFEGKQKASRDGSIEGTGYLTYTLVDNSTYNVDQCLDFCDHTKDCVFVNIYYELNNPLLDWIFSEKSNLKCAAYADVHYSAEKTNIGGQQLEELPHDSTYIQRSSGYASLTNVAEPEIPDGYELVFGPTDGANNAPGYMGFVFLDRYDVQACADLCNSRDADSIGGGCQYFNIWRAVVNGSPVTYTCAMYYIVADESTAVNWGQGDLKVTQSRGYARQNLLPDGGFEGYDECPVFCFTSGYEFWKGISPAFGHQDATIFHYTQYAHNGHGVALLGSADGRDNFPGSLTPSQLLQTQPGKRYSLQFFLSSDFSGMLEQAAFVDVMWNGEIIDTIKPGVQHWKFYSYDLTAKGNDVLQLHGGKAPSWVFLDDMNLFLA
ncbi:hypothetical protein D9758_005340 [Tetrapyrgos nigripes]|uniref:Fruit-body specific protein a n=1 Tax=Tetrapyrgos nigripes TaxID=182062 RepID=A0A8H5LPZ5_9AGAR|nr:hypothetical protein D9758_005340 [Tetrapyrgos nigripes]